MISLRSEDTNYGSGAFEFMVRARAQYLHVHKDTVYDLEFDSSKDSLNRRGERIKVFYFFLFVSFDMPGPLG